MACGLGERYLLGAAKARSSRAFRRSLFSKTVSTCHNVGSSAYCTVISDFSRRFDVGDG